MQADYSQRVNTVAADDKAGTRQGVQCPKCGSNYLVRMMREGFLQVKVYPLFGYFPWRCARCRWNFFLKRRGLAKKYFKRRPEDE